jgi:sec-independent protein translocase protein TatA
MFGGRIGPLEIGLVILLVVLIFGFGPISKAAKDLGASIRSFRDGLKGDEEKKEDDKKDE